MYIVFASSEDGLTITRHSREELLKKLNEKHWGDTEISEYLPVENDPNYWGKTIVILKGKVVRPEEKTTATEFDIE